MSADKTATAVAASVPPWRPTTIDIHCTDGPRAVPAAVHAWVPGLAIAMVQFGEFNVTHVESGRRLGGTYQRWGNAALEAAGWALAMRDAGVTPDDRPCEWLAKVQAIKDRPTSVPGCTVTGGGETRPMSWRQWMAMNQSTCAFDEFPWEAPDEAPEEMATRQLALLAPADTVERTEAQP